MSVTRVFKDNLIVAAKKQEELVNSLTERTPILSTLPTKPSTHGWTHLYEKVQSITGAGFVDYDAELPEIDATTKLEQVGLGKIGGTLYVGYDKGKKYLGGPEGYFNDKINQILPDTGESVENSIFYNNLRQYAIDNGNVINVGGSANTNYSIVVVTWEKGNTWGLIDRDYAKAGLLFDKIPLNGGTPHKHAVTVGGQTENITVFGADFVASLGILLANEKHVSAAVNIDPANSKPISELQLSQLLNKARARPGSSAIYCHQSLFTNNLQDFKASLLQTNIYDSNLNLQYDLFNNIPIITTFTLSDGLEANV